MRAYDIRISNPTTGALIQPSYFAGLGIDSTYTSLANGVSLPNALNVEMDIPVAPYAQPRQGSFIRVWGISIQEMAQAGQLNFANITVKAGMAKGLPLANPQQYGVIAEGTIFQAYGNWRGTDMTLDMTILPPAGTDNQPVNLTLNWPRGQTLEQPLRQALQTGFPGYNVNVVVSSQLVAKTDQKSLPYSKLSEFSQMIFKLTQPMGTAAGITPQGGGPYPGVNIVIKPGKQLLAYDNTADYGGHTFASPLQIQFQDLVGQPTWISPTNINFACVVRSDIQVGDYIRMPLNPQNSNPLAPPFVLTAGPIAFPGAPSTNQVALAGIFVVQEVHHFINFRQPDGNSFVTTYDAAFVSQ